MGLLDQLRQEAESARQQEADREKRQREMQAHYDEKVNPKMEVIYAYLKELEEHLVYLKPEITVEYEIPGFRLPVVLDQGDYKMEKGRSSVLRKIPFRFSCTSENRLKTKIDTANRLNSITEKLELAGVQYECRKWRDDNNQVFGGELHVNVRVPVSIVFEGVVETGSIEMMIRNYDNLTTQVSYINPDQIDDEFLDELGRFILRKQNRFLKYELTHEQKEHIRQLVLKEKKEKDGFDQDT